MVVTVTVRGPEPLGVAGALVTAGGVVIALEVVASSPDSQGQGVLSAAPDDSAPALEEVGTAGVEETGLAPSPPLDGHGTEEVVGAGPAPVLELPEPSGTFEVGAAELLGP